MPTRRATFDTTEVRLLAARLRASGALLGKDMQLATTVAARILRDEAKRRCPVGPAAREHRPGTLRDSIHIRNFFGKSAEVVCDALNESGMPYGVFVEYGTARMAPQPFMGPASDLAQDRFAALAEAGVERALKEFR